MNDKFSKVLQVVNTLLLALVIGVICLSPKTVPNVVQSLGSAQTAATHLTDSSVTTNLDSLYLWGGFEVDGTAYFDGDTRAASLVQTGSIATFTTTTAATAANVCDNPLWTITTALTTSTITLPATTTLFADCITTNGDSVDFSILNGSASTSTIIAAGSGGTMLYSSSLTIGPSKGAVVRLVRDATATYKAYLVNTPN